MMITIACLSVCLAISERRRRRTRSALREACRQARIARAWAPRPDPKFLEIITSCERFLVLALVLALSPACTTISVQCQDNKNCDQRPGGVCLLAPTGHSWCSYPDGLCDSGYRYSAMQVGDGLSGQCTATDPEMVLVPEGTFMQGCNAPTGCPADEVPYRSVLLSKFWIDRMELSRSKYMLCVDDRVCTGYSEDTNLPQATTWAQAATYCNWAHKRLPTEAEWEKAARGTDGRTYPWGDTQPNCTLSDYAACQGTYVTVDALPAGASPFGAINMAGNISEWVRDYYQSDYYAIGSTDNPQGPSVGDSNILRGGNGVSPPIELQTYHRAYKPLGTPGFGFRCVRGY